MSTPIGNFSLTPGDNNHLEVDTIIKAAIARVQEIDANLGGGTTGQAFKKAGAGGYAYGWAADISDGFRETGASVVIKTKLIEIGDWNMDADQTITVAHGLTMSKIKSFSVMIREDGGTALLPIDYVDIASAFGGSTTLPSGTANVIGANIAMARATGGTFDNASFNSTTFNRGFIYITYEE